MTAVMEEFIDEFKEWVRADFSLTCYWWGNECVCDIGFDEIAFASLNLEMEANAEVVGGP